MICPNRERWKNSARAERSLCWRLILVGPKVNLQCVGSKNAYALLWLHWTTTKIFCINFPFSSFIFHWRAEVKRAEALPWSMLIADPLLLFSLLLRSEQCGQLGIWRFHDQCRWSFLRESRGWREWNQSVYRITEVSSVDKRRMPIKLHSFVRW